MKGRLSSKVWTLTVWVFLAVFGVLGLAYRAGSNAVAESPGHGGIDVWLIGGGALALLAGLSIPMALSGSLLSGVRELAEFSERFAAGDSRAKADVKSDDELGYIAENLNRAVAKVSKATSNQEATETLQRSITDLLGVINQVARGDLTLRGKVTNDALGNVVDSINYMLDNFTKVLERVRKAATDVGRAGEAGRGFAVVADEVRKLAEHSRSATKDIAALIKAIQAETNEAVVVMEEGTKEVEVGAGLADQAGKALEAISSVVRQSAELVQEISLASKQQVRGTEGVANAMQIISNITRQTSQGARQTVGTVSHLVKLSDQLNEALAQFRAQSKPGARAQEEDHRPVAAALR